jgi:HEPN domain-containing protein
MKSKRELINYWLMAAKKDLPVMQHLFEKKDYHCCLFIGRLVLEKILKAIYIDRVGKSPPYKHGLLKLANLAGH